MSGKGSRQRRIVGKNGLPEIPAICACPAFPQHIALAVQRQAAIFPVIIGAQRSHQPADRRLFLTGQFPVLVHGITSRTGGLSEVPGNKTRT